MKSAYWFDATNSQTPLFEQFDVKGFPSVLYFDKGSKVARTRAVGVNRTSKIKLGNSSTHNLRLRLSEGSIESFCLFLANFTVGIFAWFTRSTVNTVR